MRVNLSLYNNSWYDTGRGVIIRSLWFIMNALFIQNRLNPSSYLKILSLRLFGAKIGKGAVLKPGMNVKYPWNLEIGDYSWIGENVGLDSLALIRIGNNVCISQGAYLETGNHDWTDPAFGLIVKSITVEDGAWVGARAVVLPGVTVGTHSVVAAGAVLSEDAEPYFVYAGNPAVKVNQRIIGSKPDFRNLSR